MIIHDEDLPPLGTTCIHCKKPLSNSVKYISKSVDDEDLQGLKEIVFLDSHKVCAKKAFTLALLNNEIKELKKQLLKLEKQHLRLTSKAQEIPIEEVATLN